MNPSYPQATADRAALPELCYSAAMNSFLDVKAIEPVSALIGAIRRIGSQGPLYEVLAAVDDKRVLIRVIDTGEEVPYPIAAVREDPTN